MAEEQKNMETHFEDLGRIMERYENASAHIVVNGAGCIETWCLEAERLLGWTAQEAVGQNLGELIVPEDLRAMHHEKLQSWQDAEHASIVACRLIETAALHKDGSFIPVLVSVQVVWHDLGVRFLGWVVRRDG